MKKSFNMMLIIIVCAIIGVALAQIISLMYSDGILIDEILSNSTISLSDLQFIVVLLWLMIGIILGATRR